MTLSALNNPFYTEEITLPSSWFERSAPYSKAVIKINTSIILSCKPRIIGVVAGLPFRHEVEIDIVSSGQVCLQDLLMVIYAFIAVNKL